MRSGVCMAQIADRAGDQDSSGSPRIATPDSSDTTRDDLWPVGKKASASSRRRDHAAVRPKDLGRSDVVVGASSAQMKSPREQVVAEHARRSCPGR